MILGCTLKKIARLASLAAGGAPNMVEYGTVVAAAGGSPYPSPRWKGAPGDARALNSGSSGCRRATIVASISIF